MSLRIKEVRVHDDVLDLELVVGSSMVKVVAQRSDEQSELLHVGQVCPH